MDQKFSSLKKEFDEYLQEIKTTTIYNDYIHAKKVLVECEQANYIMNQIKETQKAVKSCNKNNIDDLAKELEMRLEKLLDEYDLLFEVVQFNYAYEKLYELVSELKIELENRIN